jgi:membrane protease YdiL (CAAX protease family)
MNPWRIPTLLLAVLVIPGTLIGFRLLGRPGGNEAALGVEVAAFALSALMLWLASVKQGLSWAELGLAQPKLWPTAGLTGLGLLGVAAGLAACLGAFHLLGLAYGEGDGVERPMWLLTAMIVRAGVVEELTFRSIAIDHTASLTGSKTLGWLLPVLLFGALHFSQGITGVVIATVTGGIITALYLWKRNLWANFAIHFIVDFVPNILLPLLGVME